MHSVRRVEPSICGVRFLRTNQLLVLDELSVLQVVPVDVELLQP